jgi:release factor glutamine methyltransferase
MVRTRAAGVPLEHVLGWAEFYGLRIAVDPGVFVPRRRTEFLVSQATALARAAFPARHATAPASPGVLIVDLCCGSGAVGAALTAALTTALGKVELYAVDIDQSAVNCARRNVDAAAQVYQGDLYGPLPARLRGRVQLLVANAPYVPTEEIGLLPPEARVHEPRAALDGGADGLDIQRRVAAEAGGWLAPDGYLLIETGGHQAPRTARAFAAGGLVPKVVSSAEHNATVVIGTRPPQPA